MSARKVGSVCQYKRRAGPKARSLMSSVHLQVDLGPAKAGHYAQLAIHRTHGHVARVALTFDEQKHGSIALRPHRSAEIVDGVDGLPVDFLNHVASLETGIGGATVGVDLSDDQPLLALFHADPERSLVAAFGTTVTA